MKVPNPAPSFVLLLSIVGFVAVFQHTPLAVTDAPPSLVTLPPLVADVAVIPLASSVVTVGRIIVVLKFTWLP